MRRLFALSVLLLALLPAFSQEQAAAQEKLLSLFRNLSEYDSKCSQEKVYLHLDNNGYFTSENIYFKAYVVRASTLKPTEMSKVLYVELLDEDGNLVLRKNYEIVYGQASGSLPLNDLMHSGFYEVRAFTRAMLNWDGDYCFSRLVPVYETNDTTGMFTNAFIRRSERKYDVPIPRKESSTLRSDSVQRNEIYVELYPEGGARVEGLEQQVAFRVTNKKGLPEQATCRLYDSNGAVVSASKTEHEGMGSFLLPANGTGLRLTFTGGDGKERDFKLPSARMSGVAASITETEDSLRLELNSTADLAGSLTGISVTCRGAACLFDTIRQGGRRIWSMPKRQLNYGINQITLFNADGNILWERLVWKKPQWPVALTVKQNASAYSPFEPVVLDMKLADRNGNPCNAYFSLAVHDVLGEKNGTDITANADLLLSSDLKGFVYRPEYYFESDDAEHRRALDLLLMVQGWRRYDWREMSGVKPFKLVQPVEEGQLLTGSLLTDNGKRAPIAGARLDVNIFFPGLKVSGSCLTDSAGNFALLPPSYYNEGIGRFRTFIGDKEKSMRVRLDRNFAPALRTLDPLEFETFPYVRKPQAAEENTFEWTDTISKGDILLGAAVVKAKRRDNYSNGRRTWMGGENFARRNCNIYYNIPYETMRYCDKGERTPLLWELLRELNDKFDYFHNDNGEYTFKYRNEPILIVIENEEQPEDFHLHDFTIFANEVSSVYIATERETLSKFRNYGVDSEKSTYVMFVYMNDDPELMKEKGKSHVVRFFGYSVDEDFPSPDYRKRELPDKRDFRRTLYWNPDVLADEEGKASVVFYSNSLTGVELGITARAVLPDGEILDFSR